MPGFWQFLTFKGQKLEKSDALIRNFRNGNIRSVFPNEPSDNSATASSTTKIPQRPIRDTMFHRANQESAACGTFLICREFRRLLGYPLMP
jgi:hypothetical protein